MNRALQMRRMDIVTLLVEHGFDPRTVDMRQVFESWDPNMMDYFIDAGQTSKTGIRLPMPFADAYALRLRVFKKYRDLFPSIKEQANTALRYHCKEGNLKWVSLMLWAGADPYAPGPEDEDKDRASDYCGLSAIALAALHRHYDIFGIKQLRLDPKHPGVKGTIYFLADDEGFPILKRLLEAGMGPKRRRVWALFGHW